MKFHEKMAKDYKEQAFTGTEVNADASEDSARTHRGRNDLNDLDTREWLLGTKSIWYQDSAHLSSGRLAVVTDALKAHLGDEAAEEMLEQIFDSVALSKPPTRDPLKIQHPATFAESDIERLIAFFSKANETVLDPFLGSGSTLLAARSCERRGIGIEVTDRWADLAQARLDGQPSLFADPDSPQEIRRGDARSVLSTMPDDSVDFIVTSPPYWSVLNKPADHKVREERLDRGLDTNYSNAANDLGNIDSYEEFLDALGDIFSECVRVLRTSRYIAVVVSDFRDKSKFYLLHADVASLLEECGLRLSGITILVQDSKTLYPYGMPYAFVSNIHHQYVVIARKPTDPTPLERRVENHPVPRLHNRSAVPLTTTTERSHHNE